MSGFPLLSLMLGVPALAAVACLFMSAREARWCALGATLVTFALGVVLWAGYQIRQLEDAT